MYVIQYTMAGMYGIPVPVSCTRITTGRLYSTHVVQMSATNHTCFCPQAPAPSIISDATITQSKLRS